MNSENSNKQHYEEWYKTAKYKKTKNPVFLWMFDIIDKLFQNVEKNSIKSILDVGCGTGSKTFFLNTMFPKASTLGIDIASSGIDAANAMYKEVSNLNFKTAEANDSEIWSDSYDLISAFEVLEHIDDWQSLLDKFIASSNRYILLSVPIGRMRKYEAMVGHVRNFTKNELEDYMKKNGFKPVEVFYAGFPFFNPLFRDALGIFYKITKAKPTNLDNESPFFVQFFCSIFYFFLKYCSTKRRLGEQFLGLFEKRE